MNRKNLIALAAAALLPFAMIAQAAPVASKAHTATTVVSSSKTSAKMAKTITVKANAMSKSTQLKVVHINTATVAQLETLPGIGPKLAAQIVKNRPYKNAPDLEAKVKGISPKLWSRIKSRVLF